MGARPGAALLWGEGAKLSEAAGVDGGPLDMGCCSRAAPLQRRACGGNGGRNRRWGGEQVSGEEEREWGSSNFAACSALHLLCELLRGGCEASSECWLPAVPVPPPQSPPPS